MKPSMRYAQDAELVQVFRSAYVHLVNHSRRDRGNSSCPKFTPT